MSKGAEVNFFITHLVPDNLPPIGHLRKLLFYTQQAEQNKSGEYYWGLDRQNPYSTEQIRKLKVEKKIIELPNPIAAKKGDGIWLDSEGKVYRANIINPYQDVEKRDSYIFSPQELKKATLIYNRTIGRSNVPILSFISTL